MDCETNYPIQSDSEHDLGLFWVVNIKNNRQKRKIFKNI